MVHAIMLHSGESTLPRTIFHPDVLVVLVWTCLSYLFLSRSWFSLALNLLFFSFVKTLTHTYTTTLPLSLLRTPIAFLRHPVRTRTPPRNPVTTRQPYRPQPLVPSSHGTRDEVEQPPHDQLPLQTLSWLRWSAPNEPKSYDELPPVYNNCNLLIDDKNGILPRTHLQVHPRRRYQSLFLPDTGLSLHQFRPPPPFVQSIVYPGYTHYSHFSCFSLPSLPRTDFRIYLTT
jgi:hypothetical protein